MDHYLRASEMNDFELLDSGKYRGLCLGAEFCAHRLPLREVVDAARRTCEELGLDFVLISPITTEGEVDRVAAWLSSVVEGGQWVANDWGVLKWAADMGLEGQVTAGRMLGRQRRGPRVQALAGTHDEPAKAYGNSLWNDPVSLEFLLSLGVSRIELDALPWGVDRPELPAGVGLSLCGPWRPVTWSPDCRWSPGRSGECSRWCRGDEPVRMENEEDPTPLWSRGNAIFAHMEEGEVEAQARAVGADRVVWSRTIPS